MFLRIIPVIVFAFVPLACGAQAPPDSSARATVYTVVRTVPDSSGTGVDAAVIRSSGCGDLDAVAQDSVLTEYGLQPGAAEGSRFSVSFTRPLDILLACDGLRDVPRRLHTEGVELRAAFTVAPGAVVMAGEAIAPPDALRPVLLAGTADVVYVASEPLAMGSRVELTPSDWFPDSWELRAFLTPSVSPAGSRAVPVERGQTLALIVNGHVVNTATAMGPLEGDIVVELGEEEAERIRPYIE